MDSTRKALNDLEHTLSRFKVRNEKRELSDIDLEELAEQTKKQSAAIDAEVLSDKRVLSDLNLNLKVDTLVLNARSTDLRTEHMQKIPEFIKKHPEIKNVEINYFAFNGRAIRDLVTGEITSKTDDAFVLSEFAKLDITSLTMTNCNLGDADAIILCKNKHIKNINLSCNHIDKIGAVAIINGMNLESLPNLKNNGASEKSPLDSKFVESLFEQRQQEILIKKSQNISKVVQTHPISQLRSISHPHEVLHRHSRESGNLQKDPRFRENDGVKLRRDDRWDGDDRWSENNAKVQKKTTTHRAKMIDPELTLKSILTELEKYILNHKPFSHKWSLFSGKNFKTSDNKVVVVPEKMIKPLEAIKHAKTIDSSKKIYKDYHLWQKAFNNVIAMMRDAAAKSKSSDKKRKQFYSLFLPVNKHEFCKQFSMSEDLMRDFEERKIITAFKK